MPPWQVLVNNALIHGFGLSLGVVAIMAISIALAPDMWVGDYPPDVREKYGKKSSRAAILRLACWAARRWGLFTGPGAVWRPHLPR